MLSRAVYRALLRDFVAEARKVDAGPNVTTCRKPIGDICCSYDSRSGFKLKHWSHIQKVVGSIPIVNILLQNIFWLDIVRNQRLALHACVTWNVK